MPFSQDLTGRIEPTAKTWQGATDAQKLWYYGQVAKLAERKKRVELMQAIGRFGVMAPRKHPRADGADGPVMDPHGGASRAFQLLASSATAKGCKLFWRAGGAIVSKSGTVYFTDVLNFHASGLVRGAPVRDVRLSDESIAALRAEGESVWRKRPKQSGATTPKPATTPAPIKLSKSGPIHVPTKAFKTILPPKGTPAPGVKPKPAPKPAPPPKPKPVPPPPKVVVPKPIVSKPVTVKPTPTPKPTPAPKPVPVPVPKPVAPPVQMIAPPPIPKGEPIPPRPAAWSPREPSEFRAFTSGREMDEWGKAAYESWATNLPVLERNAIRVYAGDNYKWMNAILRGQVPDDMPGGMGMQNARRYIENAAAGLKRGKAPEAIVTHRGIQDSAAMGLPDPSKLARGQELTIEAFGSTSLSRQKAADFASAEGWGDHMAIFQVNQPKGSTGAYLNGGELSQYDDEREFLMPPGARMKFVGMGPPHVLTGGREVPVAIFERVE